MNIQVELITRSGCRAGERVRQVLTMLHGRLKQMDLQIFDLNKKPVLPDRRQATITPAVWVNGKLWFMGGFDPTRFWKRLQEVDDALPILMPFPEKINRVMEYQDSETQGIHSCE